jgi:hypothetical protein
MSVQFLGVDVGSVANVSEVHAASILHNSSV